ncbi:MAG TPA: hypothetical protein DCG32_05245 [Sphaerochaeta sp.]|nr:hypothetical protein [Sphaerochaeta sp.]
MYAPIENSILLLPYRLALSQGSLFWDEEQVESALVLKANPICIVLFFIFKGCTYTGRTIR